MMAKCPSPLLLSLALLAVVWRAYGDDDFSLLDALDDVPTQKPKPAPKPPKVPTHNTGDFDLSDFFDPTQPPKVVPKPRPKNPDVFVPTTRKPRGTTNKPPKKTGEFNLLGFFDPTQPPKGVPKPPPKKSAPNDFDLSDALDDKNDRREGGSTIKDKDKPSGGHDFSDSDLDIFNDGYKPDKGKGGSGGAGGSAGGAGRSDNSDSGNLAETGTIAGIASALAMALIGAVSSYISYQQKKFCFSIQQGLNAEYVKGENMEAVVSEEPQVKYSTQASQFAAPPAEDPSKV